MVVLGVMGRKPIEDKRTQFNRYVAGATPPLVKSLAAQLGLSEGAVIDRAVQTLAIVESFGSESLKDSGVAQSVERRPVKSNVVGSSPAAGAKISRPRFLQRRK